MEIITSLTPPSPGPLLLALPNTRHVHAYDAKSLLLLISYRKHVHLPLTVQHTFIITQRHTKHSKLMQCAKPQISEVLIYSPWTIGNTLSITSTLLLMDAPTTHVQLNTTVVRIIPCSSHLGRQQCPMPRYCMHILTYC